MATKTDFLNLVLPANNEYNNNWDTVLNENFRKIDLAIEEVTNEVQEARGSKTTVAEFLSIGHFSDGSLRPTQEVMDARNSFMFGDDDGAGTDYFLKERLQNSDKEIYTAREGLSSLSAGIARKSRDFDYPDMVVNGAKTALLQPNFMTGSGTEFQLNGTPTEIEFNIDGYYMRLRTDETVAVTGADGTRYLYAQKPATPIVVLSRVTQQAGSTTTNPLNSNKVQLLQDTGVDFTVEDIKVGDILEIINTINAGQYLVAEIAPAGNVNQIKVVGRFASVITNINYKISDPLKPVFGVDTTISAVSGKCYIGQGEYVSGALTTTITYAFKGKYESSYEAINVSSLPTFEKIFDHNLGYIPKKIFVYATQANDDSLPVEPLSIAGVGHDLVVAMSNTQSHTPGVFNAGTTDATFTGGALVGDVTGALSGNVFATRSVMIKVTKTKVYVKNVRNNYFYRDYDGSDQQAGYLKVVCEK